MPEKRKVIITITGEVQEPRKGEQYCDWGLSGRTGFSCDRIKEITKEHLILEEHTKKIRLPEYYFKEIMDNSQIKKKINVKVYKVKPCQKKK